MAIELSRGYHRKRYIAAQVYGPIYYHMWTYIYIYIYVCVYVYIHIYMAIFLFNLITVQLRRVTNSVGLSQTIIFINANEFLGVQTIIFAYANELGGSETISFACANEFDRWPHEDPLAGLSGDRRPQTPLGASQHTDLGRAIFF